MKHLILFILLICADSICAQDSLIISRHRFLNDELMACKQSKNQLVFLDNLISLTINEQPPTKDNQERFFKIQNEKLVIYHIDANWICRLRGNFDQAHKYMESGEIYLDALKSNNQYDDALKNTIGAYNNIQKQICYHTYQKDTATFYAWDCAKFFPELNEVPTISSDTLISDSTNTIRPPKERSYGKFYLNDSLKIKKRLICESDGVDYFNSIKNSLLDELKYTPIPELLLEMMVSQPFRQDTLILKLDLNYNSQKISKESSIVYSTLQANISKHYLSLFSNMNYPNVSGKISFYIPIILRPESPNNYNKMHRITIDTGYFLIEYETPRPIETD